MTETTIDKHMFEHMNLKKGIGRVYINGKRIKKTLTNHLWRCNNFSKLSSVALAWMSWDQNDDASMDSFPLPPWKFPHYIGFRGLTIMRSFGKWLRILLHELGFDFLRLPRMDPSRVIRILDPNKLESPRISNLRKRWDGYNLLWPHQCSLKTKHRALKKGINAPYTWAGGVDRRSMLPIHGQGGVDLQKPSKNGQNSK